MRKLLLALALWLGLASSAWAIGAPTNIGTAFNNSVTTTFAIATTGDAPAGSLLIMAVNFGGNATSFSITGGGLTWLKASTVCTFNSTNRLEIWYAQSPSDTPPSTTFTANWTNVVKVGAALINVTGLATSSPLDVQGVCAISGGSTSSSVASGTLGNANEIVIGAVGTSSTISAFSANSPFTNLTSPSSSAGQQIGWGYDIVSVTTGVTFAPTWTTSRLNGANVWTFIGSGSGSTRHNLTTTGAGQ